MPVSPLNFESYVALWIAIGMVIITMVIALLRRPDMPGVSQGLVGLGLASLCLAAGEMTWQFDLVGPVKIMVDLSPSTRSAEFRQRARLEARVHQLLGPTPYQILYFADRIEPVDASQARLTDLPADHTVYAPPPGASAVVLFSDGQFDPPAPSAVPTYPVLDPALEHPGDASVAGLDLRGQEAAIRVHNDGLPRALSLTGTHGPARVMAPRGATTIERRIQSAASGISAHLSPGDSWPENDALSGPIPPAVQAQRWIVGAPAPGAEWQAFSPADLPTDSARYLAPSVIVLDNVPARALSQLQQDRLRQYVRDLGGGVVVLGGDHAFAAGGYAGSTLDTILPLASTPPRPTTHWMLLADASGSMNGATAGGPTLWQYAADAIVKVLPHLPPDDLLSIGSFSDQLNWWSVDRSVRDARSLALPPAALRPHGPTNLRPALEQIAQQAQRGVPIQLLLLTDADTDLGDIAPLVASLKAKEIHISLLALGEGRGLAALRRIVQDTGGQLIQQDQSTKWAAAMEELARQASPRFLETRPLQVQFLGGLSDVQSREIASWNRTWPKAGATPMVQGAAGSEMIPLGARWNVGEGAVLALAFGGSAAPIARLADEVSRRPRDPRFRITWETGPSLRVSVDATSGDQYLNGQALSLEVAPLDGAATQPHSVSQTGPGQYALSLPAPRSPAIATLRANGQAVDRIAVAGRYAPEFDHIGTDYQALRTLASQTGGQIIDPLTTAPIDFHWPRHQVRLTPWLAALGALLIAAGLVWWKTM